MPLQKLLFYVLPAIPIAALTLPLYIIVPTFYSETLGLSLGAVGGAIIAVRIIDAVTDPVIGWLSDRWRPAIGRRRAFFLLALPLAAVSCVMLFWPPQQPSALYLALWGAGLSMGFTAMQLPYTAWGAELAGNYRMRSRIAGYREAFTLVGTLIAIVLPFAIGIDSAEGLHGLAVLGMVVAVCLFLFGGLAVANVPEPPEYTVSTVSIGAGLRHMAGNGPFVRLIAAYFINGLANGIPATLFLYFVAQRLDAADMRGPLLFIYFLAGLFGVPLTLRLASRLGKHRAWCYAMLFNAALFSLVSLLGAGDVWLFAAICFGAGMTVAADLALPSAIQADVIDVDTARSGEQRSGLYFAAWSLSTKISLAAGVGIVFPLLALFGFDPAPDAANDQMALVALGAIYVWTPVLLKLVAAALMWNFPLDEAAQGVLRAEIESRVPGSRRG
jgi:GPH family glycoside/pentoside/hexuronide:cation symporter